ncbi:Hypothetical_protein [Hexamita inflata]|uniref:Hypothetical_protein n=1 Tax=Hexamita inflata TaxID=28002 RepID=A0ABP1I1A8_9EUKA
MNLSSTTLNKAGILAVPLQLKAQSFLRNIQHTAYKTKELLLTIQITSNDKVYSQQVLLQKELTHINGMTHSYLHHSTNLTSLTRIVLKEQLVIIEVKDDYYQFKASIGTILGNNEDYDDEINDYTPRQFARLNRDFCGNF